MLPAIVNWSDASQQTRAETLQRPVASHSSALCDDVRSIVAAVRTDGDQALRSLTRQFDNVEVEEFRVSDDEIEAASSRVPRDAVEAIDLAIANVRRFHQQQRAAAYSVETMPGVRCERRYHPIDAVGLYVPAGTAPLPSAAIMLAVPAGIAGCPMRILCTPPNPSGFADDAVVVAAARAGVREIFKIGGAQAVAAMAYGTESVPRVNKIFGPGNAWVTEAKAQVAADADGAAIDMPAGPSEVLVVADESAVPEFVAADLLSQAEHGEDSQVVLVTTSGALANAVCREIETQLPLLSRAPIATQALAHARIVICSDMDEAVAISNDYAPEHLILQCEGARDLLADVRNAGSVFVGSWTPESVGDYCSGTNHVLPTYGYARSYSGLGVEQFLRQMTVQELTRDGLENLGGAVMTLAKLEGLDAHAQAVSRRLGAAP